MTSNRFAGLFATLKPQTASPAPVTFIPSKQPVHDKAASAAAAAVPSAPAPDHTNLHSQPTVQINLAQQLVQNVFLSRPPVASDTEDGEIHEPSAKLSNNNNDNKRSFEQLQQPEQEQEQQQQEQQQQQPNASKPNNKRRKNNNKSKKAKLDTNGGGTVSLDASTSSSSSLPPSNSTNKSTKKDRNNNSNATSPLHPDQKKKEAPKRPYQSYICCVCGLTGVHFYHDCDNPNGAPPNKSYLCRICKEPGHHVKWCPKKDEYFAPKQTGNLAQQQQEQQQHEQQQPIQNHQWRDRQMQDYPTHGQQQQGREWQYPNEHQHHEPKQQNQNVRNQQLWGQHAVSDQLLQGQQLPNQQIQEYRDAPTGDEIPQEPQIPAEEDTIHERKAMPYNPELISSESCTAMYSHSKNETEEFKVDTQESTHNSSMFNPFSAGSFNYNYNYNPEPSKIAPAFDPSEYTQKFTASVTAASNDQPLKLPNDEPPVVSNDPKTHSAWNPTTRSNSAAYNETNPAMSSNQPSQELALQPIIDQKHQRVASKPFCRYARYGKCRNPTTCRFNHDKSLEPCVFLNLLGGCRNGFHCEFSHADIGDIALRDFKKQREAYQERKNKEKIVWDMVKAGWISSEHAKLHFGIDLSNVDLASLHDNGDGGNGIAGGGKGVVAGVDQQSKQRMDQELEVPPWFQGINFGSRSESDTRMMGSQGFGGF
ncbi:hypothetical protein BJ741DRAFT_593836 [Chytriomyces cf. hyalinus JEL632]|nr:hypothetical protein BJ741DRAFT_593836 [Chytriomyces cf. hyalinus JEL632]